MFPNFLIVILSSTLVSTKTLIDPAVGNGPLNLTPLLEKGEIENARNLSAVDPTLFAGVESHSGYFTVNKTGGWNLFFWYFPVQGKPLEGTPLIIWLQGGPGCSSLFSLFREIGPLQIVDGKVSRMPISWGADYSLLFIDNPVGAGFSYSEGGEYPQDEDSVGASLLSFLQQFLEVFQLRKAPLFIAGESYAGKYIPALGYYIHTNKNSSMPINLKGLAIGDGWTDPPTLLHSAELALQIGLVDQKQADQIHAAEEAARKSWDERNITAYEQAAEDARTLLSKYAPVDVYNYINFGGDLSDLEFDRLMNTPAVQTALHVKAVEFKFCVNIPSLRNDVMNTVKPWLEELLEYYGVMCYNGQLDLLVGYALSVHTYRSLQWSGRQHYLDADRLPVYDDKDSNRLNFFKKSSSNFWDVMVRSAGHMVPMDQPRGAKQMIDLFVSAFK